MRAIASSVRSLSKRCPVREADITAGGVAKLCAQPALRTRKRYPRLMPMSMRYVTSVTLISLILILRQT